MANNEAAEILNVFREAALSVTKLYKTAASSQAKSRSHGYQECLDELLAYLDRENIGVDDGEGWKIRRWATERLEDAHIGQGTGAKATEVEVEAEADGEAGKDDVSLDRTSPPVSSDEEVVVRSKTKSLSPGVSRHQPRRRRSRSQVVDTPPVEGPRQSMERDRRRSRTGSAQNDEVTPSIEAVETTEREPARIYTLPTADNFEFRSNHQWPNIERLDLSDARSTQYRQVSIDHSMASSPPPSLQQPPPTTAAAAPIFPNLTISSSGGRPRTKAHRHGQRAAAAAANRAAAGQKRKFNIQDFFDVGIFKDGFGPGGGAGGNKKSRHN